jgi:hypothetical protein
MWCAQRWLDCTLEEVHAGCVKSAPRLARARDDPGPAPLDLVMRVPPGAAAGLRFVFPGQVAPAARLWRRVCMAVSDVCLPWSQLKREKRPMLPGQ